MTSRAVRALAAVLLSGASALAAPAPLRAESLDWEVQEEPAGTTVSALRSARDGFVGLFDDATDLQLALFSDVALLSAKVLMAASDGIGLLDDNPVTQHVFKSVASKSLAKTAYLVHLVGSEAIAGSHGMERERYLEETMVSLNPLLDPEEQAPQLPLDPLDFLGESLFHRQVYTTQIPGLIALCGLLADGVVRPVGNLQRIASVPTADRFESEGRRLVRSAVE